MRKAHIFEDLKDWQNKTHTLAEGFLAACQIYGFPAPYSLELQPDTATAWVAAQIINYYTKLDEQMRMDAQRIVETLGVTPDYVKGLLPTTESGAQPAEANSTATEQPAGTKPGPAPKDGEIQPAEPPAQPTTQPVRNRNPQLTQVMNLFQNGAPYLGTITHEGRRELANMVLTANRNLGDTPFWNDIEGFIDPYGYPLTELTTSPVQQVHATSVDLKRQYLSTVVIPECLRILADYIRREICANGQMDDAAQVSRFLSVF